MVIRSRGERPGTGLVASWTARAGTPVDTSLVIGVVVGSVGGLLVLVGAGFAIAKWKPKRKGELVQDLRAALPCCFLCWYEPIFRVLEHIWRVCGGI